ncbi:MAG: helix-turn-helix domain-containing protein [Lentisphaeria bacterium]|nr:helix-turn-helix domain-containing protein [Lentisphaeria bacterium]
MDFVFKKSKNRTKKWDENYWFSSSFQGRKKQMVIAFYGESTVFDSCEISCPGCMDLYCFEYIVHGKGTLIDADNSQYLLSPGTMYIISPERHCRIIASSEQGLQKVMLGITNGTLLQMMLYHSLIGSGELLHLADDSEAINLLLQIGKKVKTGSVSEQWLATECYRFLLQLSLSENTTHSHSLHSVIEYMQNNLQNSLSLDQLAAVAGMTKISFIRKFREEFGCTPIQHLITLRLNYAKNLLKLPYMSINEVATLCGYRNVKFFSREYHRHFKFPPSQNRNG